MRKLLVGILGLALVAACFLWWAGRGGLGRFDSEDHEPQTPARSEVHTQGRQSTQRLLAAEVGAPSERQILFGDLHVHTTISFDAFMLNLPVMGGQGAHPPADACDFARHCAALDFWSINDHAANIQPEDWKRTIAMIRQCNDIAGDAATPDMVSFLGWEWTQAGRTADEHYGHKNVVLAHTDDARIPTRPIAANAGGLASNPPPVLARGLIALQGGRFADMAARWTAISESEICGEGDVRGLPADCREIAHTPADLFRKLDEWGHDSIVIPHGTTWGIYTPPTSSWDKQLQGAMHDPDRQTLIEMYSGHGDSEVYRDWRPVEIGADGEPVCPPERPDFLPMCRRAGQLILERCSSEGIAAEECEARAERARRYAVRAGVSPQTTVPGATGADWLDAGQCRDCGQPAFKYRPAGSAQYLTALGNFDEAGEPRRFRMGFMASSDIHVAKPGTGYKEVRGLSESRGGKRATSGIAASFVGGEPEEPVSEPRTYEEASAKLGGLQLYETERTQSFLYTGGLIAVHAEGRGREAIWSSMQRREVYGTSGTRMLLWFDLVDGETTRPMGSELTFTGTPTFRVKAVGSFVQAPGCPEEAVTALGPERLDRLCMGECQNPTDQRKLITRIEVIRILPQITHDEEIRKLIADPWKRFDCPGDPSGCTFEFSDPEYEALGRDAVYYARVFEQAVPTVNGAPLRCEFDDEGRCIKTRVCGPTEECSDLYEARAWSSPIFLDRPRG